MSPMTLGNLYILPYVAFFVIFIPFCLYMAVC